MAGPFRLVYPLSKTRISTPKFVACGTAPPGAAPLFGILVGGKGTVATGLTLRQPPADSRWIFFFNLKNLPPKAERFTLCICRKTDSGCELLAKATDLAFGALKGVGVAYPSAGSSLCSTLVPPYGTVTDPDSKVVTVQLVGGPAPINADAGSIYNDGEGFWCAMFSSVPDLAAGSKYELDVYGDVTPAPAQVANLDIRSTNCVT
jgi:hypothetical protein